MDLDAVIDEEKGIITLDSERLVWHCNHYNIVFQKTLEDALGDNMDDIQVEVSKKHIKSMLNELKNENPTLSVYELAERLFKRLGLGTIDFSGLNDGKGIVKSPVSHFALAYYYKFDKATRGICHFVKGFILATIELATNQEISTERISETECRAMGPEEFNQCVFEVR